MLFATLDITTRAIYLEDNRLITLTDTVGFVRKLPHELVEAFKSTLEEVIYADLLLHVVDSSSLEVLEQIKSVEDVLFELGAADKQTILVLNKIDKVSKEHVMELRDRLFGREIIETSAKEGINLKELLALVGERLPETMQTCEFLIPYTEQRTVSLLHRRGRVLHEEYKEEGTLIKAQVDEETFNRCRKHALK